MRNFPIIFLTLLSCVWGTIAAPLQAELPPEVVWSKVLGADEEDDFVHALAIDDLGNVVIAGETRGALFRADPYYFDGYYASYDPVGNLRWGHQLGRFPNLLEFSDVVALPLGGWGVIGTANYSVGSPLGVSTTHYGSSDVVMVGLGTDGFIDWMTQIGTSSTDAGRAIVAKATGVGYAGDTYGSLAGPSAGGNDAFVGRFTSPTYLPPGSHSHQGQFGTDDWDLVSDMDAGFVAGTTHGSFSGANNRSTDAFLARTDINGEVIWTRQYGDNQPQGADAVVADGNGSVYIAGYTYVHGSYSAGDGPDGFLAKYDDDGNLQWERFLTSDGPSTPSGTAKSDRYTELAVDAWGNIYVGGNTDEESTTPSTSPAIVAKYSPSGELLWSTELEFDASHRVTGLAVDPSGTRIWLAGNATGPGTFGEDNTADAFLAYLESPYPAGDFDHDGQVTGRDFLAWQRADLADSPRSTLLGLWEQTFGTSIPQELSAQTPVPEPTTWMLTAAGIGLLSARRRTPRLTRLKC